MKKLSIAIVLVSAGFGFAKAQTTESATTKVKTEATLSNAVKADTAVMITPAESIKVEEAVKAETVPVEAVKKETPAEMKQKAKLEKKAAKNSVE